MVAQLDRQYAAVVGPRGTARRAASYALFEGRPATTKGQWFNPVVRANLSRGLKRAQPALDRPIFILGVGRSGTTHLGKLLSAHPDVGWLNEPKMIWYLARPGEDVSGFYAPSGRYALGAENATGEVRQRAHRLFGHYLKSVGATRLVDKSPALTFRVSYLKALFPDSILLAIVRRPEDFVNSVSSWNDDKAVRTEDWWGVRDSKWLTMREELLAADPDLADVYEREVARPLSPNERSATEWVLGMKAIAKARSEIAMTIRYEDLATSPAETMARLLEACELSGDGKVLELAKRATSSRLRTDPADFGALGGAVATTREVLGV